jgi:16S rRNA (uracil1498-N3)-methyltransferase
VTSGPADVRAAAHAFVTDLGVPTLTDADRHHLERVLRVAPSAIVTVSDGSGRWRTVRFGPRLEPLDAIERVPRPAPRLTVGFALVKGERPEMIVQKLTEIGIDRVVPFVADRSVVRWDAARAVKHVARLRRVAREAAMQSRRAWLLDVEPLQTFAALASEAGVCVAERSGGSVALECPVILVGPEGGWSETEREWDLPRVSLGTNVLRAETAAVVAGALLTTLRGQHDRQHTL